MAGIGQSLLPRPGLQWISTTPTSDGANEAAGPSMEPEALRPDLGAILKAIQDSREAVEQKVDKLPNYFRENRDLVVSAESLWAASKPALRGSIKKGHVRRWKPSRSLSGQPRGEAGWHLELQHAKFRQVSLTEAQRHWQASTQRVYELGDKTGKLLYWLETCNILVRVVPLLRDWAGVAQEDLPATACTFTFYYECLYARVPQLMVERENPIQGDIPLPLLLPFLAAELDLSLSEVGDAISTLQFRKTAGL
ncbi:hypothetical protein NDU88_003027 [Pleurodeles waltl]|uniref:Uncharacterized protein n=1 Tax=Pleurodeles waltl TaxID=8319 RepID=A0AAV7VC87_PLEWA|nr:hypothetical protein NDU88_003027 [Pleurodeles waltl]